MGIVSLFPVLTYNHQPPSSVGKYQERKQTILTVESVEIDDDRDEEEDLKM